MQRWLYAVPVAALLAFGGLALLQLLHPEKQTFERASRAAPVRDFAQLGTVTTLRFSPPPNNSPIIVNLFASWCGPCEAEHPLLVELARAHPDQVYGVLYKDSEANGAEFLAKNGNPYTRVALDPDGTGGLDFGLTGVPETFVISRDGEILLHINRPLTRADLAKIDDALKAP